MKFRTTILQTGKTAAGIRVPDEVVEALGAGKPALARRTCRRGSRVRRRVPKRGDKKALRDTVARNAGESLALHKTRRASDLTTRSRALHEITDALGLAEAPLRIECYDVSNLQGTEVVASMVVFEDGLARKGERLSRTGDDRGTSRARPAGSPVGRTPRDLPAV